MKFVDRDSHWYTRRVKESIHIRLNQAISKEIVESEILKLGYTYDQKAQQPINNKADL